PRSTLQRNPDLDAAQPGARIEGLGVALEIRRICRLVTGLRQPPAPDRVDGAPDRRDVLGVPEEGIALGRNAHAAELRRQSREILHLDAGDVVEIAFVIAVAADAVGGAADRAGNVAEIGLEALP